jgi:hypothetical protein
MSSPAPIPVRERWIVHFTHVDNLVMITRSGRLACDATARSGLMRTEVGDPAIKNSRRRRRIPVGPGGCVGDYVPFYFAPRSPMMYRIACDHRDSIPGRYPDGDRPLVYLATTVGAVVDAGVAWVATDGNAANATTGFTTISGELDGMIDWPLMHADRWNNTEDDPDRQRRRMAEFLVHRELPLDVFRQRVVVRPSWYYGYEQRGG